MINAFSKHSEGKNGNWFVKFVKIFLLKKPMHYAVYVMPSIYIATFF